jgi:23S rRNA pseudouridine1911/1915/1917 synthase
MPRHEGTGMTEGLEPLVVPPALAGERIDRAVALLTGWSRRDVQDLVISGDVLVAGERVSKSRRLVEGEVIELLAGPAIDARPHAEPVPLDVRHADDDIVVVAKPAGLVVHPGAGHASGTLVNGLLAQFPDLVSTGDPYRPGIVHRLDRETSGLLVVARSPRAYDALVAAFGEHDIERRYVALVWGTPAAPRGVVDAPIGRSPRARTRMAVRASGRAARTRYEVRRSYDTVSLLDCMLETGRTHQVRVHLAAMGHPVVGDGAYGGDRPGVRPGRPFLHAAVLGFRHPGTGEPMRFEDPLPPELAAVLTSLDEAARDDAAVDAPGLDPPALDR